MHVDELAVALRHRDALRARVLYAELAEQDMASIESPTIADALHLAIAASIVELMAARAKATPPAWTTMVSPLAEPYVLVTVRSSKKLDRLRQESPRELRARNLVAPENFLTSV